jgi:hypothetical protein
MPNPMPSTAHRFVNPDTGIITSPWQQWLFGLGLGAGVASFNTRTGAVTLGSSDVDAAGAVLKSALFGHIAGFEPDKLSTNVLNVNPGSCADSNASKIIASSSLFSIDMSIVGANGLDTGTPTNGTGYFPYLITRNSDGAVAGVLSSSITYGGVTVPTGYTIRRKLRFGFVYNSTRGGIPDFHLTNWPMPFIRLTGSENTTSWEALSLGTATTFTDVDLTPWIPDNARIAYLAADVSAVGTAGSAFARVLTSQATGLIVGSSSPTTGIDSYMTFWQRITSARKMQYMVTGGARLSLFVLGYAMTEPS